MGQRARRERERSEQPPIQPKFFPSLIPRRRQQPRTQSLPVSFQIGTSTVSTQGCSIVLSELAANENLITNILVSSSVSTISQEAVTQHEQSSKGKEKKICSLDSSSLPNIF